jgi:hypothetical protein
VTLGSGASGLGLAGIMAGHGDGETLGDSFGQGFPFEQSA